MVQEHYRSIQIINLNSIILDDYSNNKHSLSRKAFKFLKINFYITRVDYKKKKKIFYKDPFRFYTLLDDNIHLKFIFLTRFRFP